MSARRLRSRQARSRSASCPARGCAHPDGDIAVEKLRIGDLVEAVDGRAVAVRWVGKQTVAPRFADELRLPVRVKAGALGENVPCNDLRVSPDHALLIDGALVHAGAIVNGTSIVREKSVPAMFTYFHIEAEDHALILAENTPAETFVDNVDRRRFDNWREYEALYPDAAPIAEMTYPRAKSARKSPRRRVRNWPTRRPARRDHSRRRLTREVPR